MLASCKISQRKAGHIEKLAPFASPANSFMMPSLISSSRYRAHITKNPTIRRCWLLGVLVCLTSCCHARPTRNRQRLRRRICRLQLVCFSSNMYLRPSLVILSRSDIVGNPVISVQSWSRGSTNLIAVQACPSAYELIKTLIQGVGGKLA